MHTVKLKLGAVLVARLQQTGYDGCSADREEIAQTLEQTYGTESAWRIAMYKKIKNKNKKE